jgi:hypothetical protein
MEKTEAECQCDLYSTWMDGERPICKKGFLRWHSDDMCQWCGHCEKCHGQTEKQKTDAQRAALHVWLEQIAQILNEGGIDQTIFFEKYVKKGFKIPWSKHSVKEVMYKPILAAMSGKESTEDMNTVEPGQICQVLGSKLSELTGITPPPFPSRFHDS